MSWRHASLSQYISTEELERVLQICRAPTPGCSRDGCIILTGLAPASLMKKFILYGATQDIWWNVQDLGYLTYYAAQAYAQSKVTRKKGETFSAGRLGEYTVGDDGEVVLGPAVIVTPENVGKFKF